MCEITKEIWGNLETTYEGTKTIKNSKLQSICDFPQEDFVHIMILENIN